MVIRTALIAFLVGSVCAGITVIALLATAPTHETWEG
jgi:hypothetical protein